MAYAIADAGQIVGTSEADDGTPRAVLWSSSSAAPQDLQPGLTIPSRAYDINKHGMVVGTRERSTGDWSRAFVWTAEGGARELPSPGLMATAYAVNDSGVAVGFRTGTTAGSPERAVRWTAAGQMELLPVPAGRSWAQDVNLRGEIVGSWHDASQQQRAFFWSAQTGFIDIGTGGGIAAAALSINQSGMVVGLAVTNEGYRAWAWTPRSGMRQLEGLGGGRSAYAINRNGVVAGDAIDRNGNGRLVRWRLSEFNSAPTVVLAPGVRWLEETDSIALTAIGQDPEGDALRYAWTFGNGGTHNDPATTGSSTVYRRYGDNGSYPLQVIVSDPSGARDTVADTITVVNVAPRAVFASPLLVAEGTSFPASISALVDGAADLRAGIQVSFNCGAGTFGTPSTALNTTCPAWTDNDTITLAVRLRDKDADSTTYTRTLVIQNAAPVVTVAAGSPTTFKRGGSFTIRGSFTDRGTADGPWRYRIIWGDGTFTDGLMSAQGAIPAKQHVYRAAGTYRPYIRVIDKDGAPGTSDRLRLTVNP
jgi:probable HAF family extracellular repeat protein